MDNALQKGHTERNNTPNKKRAQNTTQSAKHKRQYGEPQPNNVGVFQGSAISALMFIIYLDDMMEDYRAINRKKKLPTGK